MTRRSGFGRTKVVSGVRRLTEWTEGPGGQSVTNTTTTEQVILGSGIEAQERLTITRILGNLQFQLKTTGGVDNGFHCTWGIGLVSGDAFGVGVSACPSPQDDMDWGGWLMHGFMPMITPTLTIDDIGSAVVVNIPVDVKAQRVMGPNDVIFCTVDYLEVGIGNLIGTTFDSRALLKVH